MAISGLYFLLTGIQFWTTDFLIVECNGNEFIVMPLFLLISAFAPVSGILFGGYYVDKLGSYRNMEGALKVFKVLICSAAVAVIVAIPASFVTNVSINILSLFCE